MTPSPERQLKLEKLSLGSCTHNVLRSLTSFFAATKPTNLTDLELSIRPLHIRLAAELLDVLGYRITKLTLNISEPRITEEHLLKGNGIQSYACQLPLTEQSSRLGQDGLFGRQTRSCELSISFPPSTFDRGHVPGILHTSPSWISEYLPHVPSQNMEEVILTIKFLGQAVLSCIICRRPRNA